MTDANKDDNTIFVKLKTDDLNSLKSGQIVVDENGKKYIVRKKLLPSSMGGGPASLGDPNDRTLRKLEADVLIPDMMDTRIQKKECTQQLMDYLKCADQYGIFLGHYTCKGLLKTYNSCKLEKFMDPKIRQEVTEEYLQMRSEYRRTGKNKNERNFNEYFKWKYGRSFEEINKNNNSNKS